MYIKSMDILWGVTYTLSVLFADLIKHLEKTMVMEDTVCVLTARGIGRVLEEGGSQAWVLDAKRAASCKYVVCVQNRGFAKSGNDWGGVSAPHHSAFLVGRLKDVVRSTEEDSENRWMLRFSEYAEIDISDSWPGFRNPVLYTSLEELKIDISSLKFEPMPVNEPVKPISPTDKGLTLAEAKAGLAKTFGVRPEDVQITIKG
jgi:hypothetical protein